jgi:two-component system OmpR family sensor kinase
VNDARYALKNAFIYTTLVALILLAPLYVYTVYMKNVHEIRNELSLKHHAERIVNVMEEFGTRKEPTFHFPRFQLVQAGLYDRHFRPVFSLIEAPIEHFAPGYHGEGEYTYYIAALPEHRYFDASYLIVGNHLSYVPVYEKVATILLSIVVLVFLLSLFFLNRFALPFKRVNQKLDNFIKDSMHEINTPLSIINVNIDLYNRKNPENKYLTRIKAAAKSLSNIYYDMDYLIKNEKGNFVYEPIDLRGYVQERIDYFMEVAAMKNIVITSEMLCDATIRFNPVQLQRIVDNNLSNAIKYSHENTAIAVRLECSERGCALSFKDEGIGIEDTERIFERYYREEGDKGGFGIGLNIVKKIADDAGIALEIASEPGKGSCFTYIFPHSMIREQPDS